jgi:hypothetical protein
VRWFKRGLWFAGWSVWLWLGVGLYRELPRTVGPALAQIPTGQDHSILGFVGDTENVVVQTSPTRQISSKLRVFDAQTLSLVRELTGPYWMSEPNPEKNGLRFGFLYSSLLIEKPGAASQRGLFILDVLKGDWRKLSDDEISSATIHPHKPWIAVLTGNTPKHPFIATVFDLPTGKELFKIMLNRPWKFAGRPLFIADRDEIVLAVTDQKGEPDEASSFVVKVWRIGTPTVLQSTSAVSASIRYPSISNDGQILLDGRRIRIGDMAWEDVYEASSGGSLSSYPSHERNPAHWNRPNDSFPIISASGRTVLRGSPAALYEVGTGRILWQANVHEELAAPSSQEVFLVSEHWGNLWRQWLPNLQFESCAVRSRDMGELLYRTPGNAAVMPFNSNAKGTLVVLHDGSVHRLPLSRDWFLLAVCQAILATPLILLWAILRWRRARQLRIASVKP